MASCPKRRFLGPGTRPCVAAVQAAWATGTTVQSCGARLVARKRRPLAPLAQASRKRPVWSVVCRRLARVAPTPRSLVCLPWAVRRPWICDRRCWSVSPVCVWAATSVVLGESGMPRAYNRVSSAVAGPVVKAECVCAVPCTDVVVSSAYCLNCVWGAVC